MNITNNDAYKYITCYQKVQRIQGTFQNFKEFESTDESFPCLTGDFTHLERSLHQKIENLKNSQTDQEPQNIQAIPHIYPKFQCTWLIISQFFSSKKKKKKKNFF